MATFDGHRREGSGSGGGKKPPTGLARRNNPVQIVEPRCKICSSELRGEVEKMLVYGYSQRKVREYFAGLGLRFSANSISTHVNKHMAMRKAVVAQMVEAQADKFVSDAVEASGVLLTTRSILETLRVKGHEQVVDGVSDVNPDTLIRVTEKLDAMDRADEQTRIDEMMLELNCFIQAVQSLVPEAAWQKISEQYNTNVAVARERHLALNKGKE